MKTKKQITNVLSIAVLSMAVVGMVATLAVAAPISIDFDSNDVVQSGEPPHALGLTLPGQVGDWYKLPVSNPQITTTEGPKFSVIR